jgi:hypothetical protein
MSLKRKAISPATKEKDTSGNNSSKIRHSKRQKRTLGHLQSRFTNGYKYKAYLENELKEMEKKYNIEKEYRIKTGERYAKTKLVKKIYKETIAICRDNNKDLKSEVDRLDTKLQNRMCICCFDQKSDVVLLPCSHLRTCLNCTRNLVKCRFCGSEISGYIKVNLK